MGLVFRDILPVPNVSRSKDVVRLTSSSVKFLRSLGFKVENVGYKHKGRVQ